MDLLDKLSKEITESNTTKKGKFRVVQGKKPQDNSGGNQGDKGDGKPGDQDDKIKDGQDGQGQPGQDGQGQPGQGQPGQGQPGQGQPGQGQPGQGQPGQGQPGQGQPGQGKPGQGQPGQGKPGNKGPKVEWKDGQLHIDGKPSGPKGADSHDGLEKGGGNVSDFDDIIKKVYDEVNERSGGPDSGAAGTGKGSTMEKVNQYLKPKFNIRPILKRLDDFKRMIGKQMTETSRESYAAAQHNPASQTGDMMRPSKIPGGKKLSIVKESAIMIFAVDTSGSISAKDFEFIFGFLKKIEEHFAKPLTIRNDAGEKVGSLTGEVFLLEWDYGVHLPLRKWTQVQRGKMVKHVTPSKEKEAAQMKLRGGGGTDINLVFKTLDKLFYRKIGKQAYFDVDETADYITQERDISKINSKMVTNADDINYESESRGKKHFRAKLKSNKRKEMKDIDQERINSDVSLEQGEPNFLEGKKKMANVPFLLFYTDGWFSKADYTLSKLYADNPGNILYILTDKNALSNCRPVNIMYHDVHGQGESSLKRFSNDVE